MSEYEIGYKKPPKQRQFKKGKSGNPNGRPKGHKNTNTILRDALSEHIMITEHGKKSEISKLEAMLKQQVNKAVQGDPRAFHGLLPLVKDLDEQDEKHSNAHMPHLSATEKAEALTMLVERVRRSNPDAK